MSPGSSPEQQQTIRRCHAEAVARLVSVVPVRVEDALISDVGNDETSVAVLQGLVGRGHRVGCLDQPLTDLGPRMPERIREIRAPTTVDSLVIECVAHTEEGELVVVDVEHQRTALRLLGQDAEGI